MRRHFTCVNVTGAGGVPEKSVESVNTGDKLVVRNASACDEQKYEYFSWVIVDILLIFGVRS